MKFSTPGVANAALEVMLSMFPTHSIFVELVCTDSSCLIYSLYA